MSEFICVDWGTSNFRAILLNEKYKQIDYISNDKGIINFQKNQFHSYLLEILEKWLLKNQNINIFISGMITSDIGWISLPHLLCDCSIDDLINSIYKVKNIKQNIYLISGIKTNKNNIIDFIRGEEIQVFGALKLLNKNNGIFVTPGTHSKWIEVQNEKIIDFKTNMTGDIFNAICNNTILNSNIKSKDIDTKYFIKGLELSKNSNGLLNQIFQVRTHKNNDESFAYSFLSGILIGSEIKYMKDIYNCNNIILIASDLLGKLYTIAFDSYNIKTTSLNSIDVNIEAFIDIYKKIKR